MKINNLYMSLIVVLFSLNITADGNHGGFQCYSSDPEMGDSAFWAGEAIESFAQNKFEEAINIVDACFAAASMQLEQLFIVHFIFHQEHC